MLFVIGNLTHSTHQMQAHVPGRSAADLLVSGQLPIFTNIVPDTAFWPAVASVSGDAVYQGLSETSIPVGEHEEFCCRWRVLWWVKRSGFRDNKRDGGNAVVMRRTVAQTYYSLCDTAGYDRSCRMHQACYGVGLHGS